MIELGLILSLVAAALACVVPAERALSVRKHHREQMPVGVPLRTAYPATAASDDLESIGRAAFDAVDACDLDRGVIGIAGVYRRAARRRPGA